MSLGMICPDVLACEKPVHPLAKIFCFAADPNQIYNSSHPGPQGAYRDRHGRWVRDAMDAAMSGAILARTNDVVADGEVVWSWRPVTTIRAGGSHARCIAPGAPPHSGSPACRSAPFILSMNSGWKQYMR